MWQRWLRNLSIELYRCSWSLRRWNADLPAGLVGILAVSSGLLLIVVLGSGVIEMFRATIPWVAGARLGDIYWASIAFSVRVAFSFLLFCASLAAFLFMRFIKRR